MLKIWSCEKGCRSGRKHKSERHLKEQEEECVVKAEQSNLCTVSSGTESDSSQQHLDSVCREICKAEDNL